MDSEAEVEALRAEVARLREEQAQLQRIAAAAQEAHAFFEGRRPGFAAGYPRDVLRAVFVGDAGGAARPGRRPGPRKPPRRSR